MSSEASRPLAPEALNAANLIVQRDTVCACLFPRRVYLVVLCFQLLAEARFLGSPAQKSGGKDRSKM
jgi:hypothetical protein